MARKNKLSQTGQQPDMVNIFGENKDGISQFFGNKEEEYLTNLGRELVEDILQEEIILYRINLKKTQPNFYGESKTKSYHTPTVLSCRVDVTLEDSKYQQEGGIVQRGFGQLEAHIYLDHIEEMGLVEFTEGQRIVYSIREGDFLAYKGQYYEIKDNGYASINNANAFAGDRRFYISIKATEVSEQIFRGK